MKKLLTLVALSIFVSCSSGPDQSTKKVVVQELHYSTIRYEYVLLTGTPMETHYVDTMYHVGDTINMAYNTYVIRRD